MTAGSPGELEALRRENRRLREIIARIWPVVTKHTNAAFWGPIERELREMMSR